MNDQFSRTELLLGEEAMKKLYTAKIAVFGIGGVGGHAAEALARSGVGRLDLYDPDIVSLSNLNRQLFATQKTVGQLKVDAAEERLTEINPQIIIRKYPIFYLPENASEYDFSEYDYIIDAIDTVSAKIELAVRAKEAGVPLISSMGAGNKLNPTAFEVEDLAKTSVCPLARVMRRELKQRGITHLKVVYSKETAMTPLPSSEVPDGARRQIPGSTAFVPAAAGLILAGEVICDLTEIRNPSR